MAYTSRASACTGPVPRLIRAVADIDTNCKYAVANTIQTVSMQSLQRLHRLPPSTLPVHITHMAYRAMSECHAMNTGFGLLRTPCAPAQTGAAKALHVLVQMRVSWYNMRADLHKTGRPRDRQAVAVTCSPATSPRHMQTLPHYTSRACWACQLSRQGICSGGNCIRSDHDICR